MMKPDEEDRGVFPTMKPLKDASGENDGKMEAGKAAGEGVTGRADVPAAIEIKDEPIDFSKVEIEPLFQDQVDFETFSKSDFRAVKVMACEAVPKSKKLLKFTLDDGTGQDRVILSGIHAYYEPEDLVGKTLIAIVNLPPRKMMGLAVRNSGRRRGKLGKDNTGQNDHTALQADGGVTLNKGHANAAGGLSCETGQRDGGDSQIGRAHV